MGLGQELRARSRQSEPLSRMLSCLGTTEGRWEGEALEASPYACDPAVRDCRPAVAGP